MAWTDRLRALGEFSDWRVLPVQGIQAQGDGKVRRTSRYPFEASANGLIAQMAMSHQGPILFEYRFHPTRRWRFDAVIAPLKIAVEYHGGLFMSRRGGHQSVKGTRNDWEKLNEAQMLGWIVLQFGADETRTGAAMQVIERAIKFRFDLAAVSHRSHSGWL